MSFGRFVTPPVNLCDGEREACRPRRRTRASHAGWVPYADLTPDESTKTARGAEAGWRGRRWWRMCELQPPGAVYQHHGKAQCSPSVRSKGTTQGKSQAPGHAQRQSGSGRQADSRATHRASASGQGREGGPSAAKSTACKRRRGRLCMQNAARVLRRLAFATVVRAH